ncbi:MAG: hypothetical protein LBB94_04095 [Clostridiales bacterium]|nr:hypothetical protein [Clostridiales bacterium]
MNNFYIAALFTGLLFLCSPALVPALGGGEREAKAGERLESGGVKLAAPAGEDTGGGGAPPQNRHVRVSGRVRLVGSAIFPELVVTGKDREWHIGKEEQQLLINLQQQFVTVEGTESYVDMTFANGMPAGRRYTLKDIKLIDSGGGEK